MIISMDAEKMFEENLAPFYDKNTLQTRNRKGFLYLINKGHL